MAVDIVGETAICSIEVKNSAGTKTDPSTSMTITIWDGHMDKVVDTQAMTKDATGEYHYDYTIAAGEGNYKVLYVATNGSRVSKGKDSFSVESETD